MQLHYLTSATPPPQSDNLIIFLHGFPDSAHLWSSTLSSSLSKTATLIALDLPGCGGSDSLPAYGANEMLNAVTEGIISLRNTYLPQSSGGVILVGHDWGGVITYRLGAEAPGLVSRIVVMNTAYVPHMSATIRSLLATARRSWYTYTEAPVTQTQLLTPAKQSLGLIGTQLLKSNYIFIFQLPFRIAHYLPSVSRYLLSVTHRLAHRERDPLRTRLPPGLAARATAASNGPSAAAAQTRTADGGSYGASVVRRAQSDGDWDQRILVYKQGLASRRWTHSAAVKAFLSSGSSPSSSTFAAGDAAANDSPLVSGAQVLTSRLDPSRAVPANSPAQDLAGFKVPATVLFGMKDPALDPRVVLDGIEAYFAPGSQGGRQDKSHVLKMAKCGHWSPVEEEGREVLGSVLKWMVEGNGKMGLDEVKGLGGGKVQMSVY